MRALLFVPLLLAAAPADQLPLAHGIFVSTKSPCKGASNFDIMSYWGGNNALNVSQAECTIKHVRHSGKVWTVERHCSDIRGDDLGDSTIKLTIENPKAFALDGTRYRWCGMKVQF